MERLPHDIIADILSRLSVKNLLQIKCVSKLWNTTISDPQFARLQIQQSSLSQENNNGKNFKILVLSHVMQQPISLNNENGSNQFGEIKHDFPLVLSDEQQIESLGCCDGMFCLEYGRQVVIWNPSIRQYRILPSDNDSSSRVLYRTYGFGFDSAANDYKVYRKLGESDKVVLEVFALKTNYWRRIEGLFPVNIYHQSRNFLHGSLHWCDHKYPSDRNRFFAFSLAREKFLEVPLPDVSGVMFWEMVVFDGCLSVYCDNNVIIGFDIWIMKEYMVKDSWTKLGTVLRDTIPNFDAYVRPLCYARDGDILLEVDHEGVVKYNMNKRSCTAVFNIKYESLDFEFNTKIEALAYVESLVSPNR